MHSIENQFQILCKELSLHSAALYIGKAGEEEFFAYGKNPATGALITYESIFDLASITKVFTTTALLQCLEKGECSLDDQVKKYIPEVVRDDLTIHSMLTHTARTDVFLSKIREETKDPEKYKQAIFRAGTMADREYFYQCQNFMMLGWIIEKISDMSLDSYMAKYIFGPIQMDDSGYRVSDHNRTVPTLFDAENNSYLQGEVHDPNARLLGGILGNAGIFSTAKDMSRFIKMWLGRGSFDNVHILKEATVDLALRKSYENPKGNFAQGLGWKLHTTHVEAEKIWNNAWMHMGYTGTLVLFHPEQEILLVLLTNLIYPDGMWEEGERVQFRNGVRTILDNLPQ